MRTTIDWKGRQVDFVGDECGPGWKNILLQLYDSLVELGWDRHLHQVKEKFGGLRFYIGQGNEAMYDAITAAEELSLGTCMDCGKPGNQEGSVGWILTLCEECRNKT